MPVLSVPLHVSGLLRLSYAAFSLVLPLSIATVVLFRFGSRDVEWAIRGLTAGLAAVSMYDAVRLPLVWAGPWPDFIPDLGGWIIGSDRRNAPLGYLWRYVGDGGGIGMSYFVFCGALHRRRPVWIERRPVCLSVTYGVFIWMGLVGTVVLLPRGESMLFPVTPSSLCVSLLGHLIYGVTLGLFLRRFVRQPG